MNPLTVERQNLRDQIWLAGPEHFDVTHLYTLDGRPAALRLERATGREEWTACFVGHHSIVNRGTFWFDRTQTREVMGTHQYTVLEAWHNVNVDGWNPGKAYDTLIADGMTDRHAQWHVAVEWLDRLIKGGEQ